MALAVNRDIVTWALAVIQPASIAELRGFLSYVLKDESAVPHGDVIADEVRELVNLKDAVKVSLKPARYSVTRKGEQRIQKKLRHLRDRMRLFLMKNASYSKFYQSSEVLVQNLDDVSSSPRTGIAIQDAQRPNGTLVADQSAIWPLVSEQFQIGSVGASGDLNPTLQYYSFGSSYFAKGLVSTQDLAEAIGISTKLVTSIAKQKIKHYRSFAMQKKSGGTRQIDSPRTFLKVIQRWVNDYLLRSLPQHDMCMSYRKGYSVGTHASLHENRNYVLNLDIENFFGSISTRSIAILLLENGFSPDLVNILKELCTLNNALPQGAPTSPILSNAFLYRFDEYINAVAIAKNVTYSRYADDMTLSGDNKEALEQIKQVISDALEKRGLQLKTKKTRLTHRSQKQVVTGLVVNQRAKPSREYRRLIRATFHAAEKNPDSFSGKSHILNGYIAYLNAYGCLKKETKEQYQRITRQISLIPTSVTQNEAKKKDVSSPKLNLRTLYQQRKFQDIINAAKELPNLDDEEESIVASAYLLFALEQNDKKDEIHLYNSLIEKFKYSRNINVQLIIANAMIKKGSSLKDLGDLARSIYTYDQMVERFGNETEPSIQVLVATAMRDKGYSLRDLNDLRGAIYAYDQMVERFGNATEPSIQVLVATAMRDKGYSLRDLNDLRGAIYAYDQMVERFGNATEPSIHVLVANAMQEKMLLLWGVIDQSMSDPLAELQKIAMNHIKDND